MCLRQGRTHPFWNGRSNSPYATTQETADWEWWTIKWLEIFKSCAYTNLNVVGTNDESRFILIKPAWQVRSRTWYAPYIHSYVRPVYQPLFGKWACAPPPKRRTRGKRRKLSPIERLNSTLYLPFKWPPRRLFPTRRCLSVAYCLKLRLTKTGKKYHKSRIIIKKELTPSNLLFILL